MTTDPPNRIGAISDENFPPDAVIHVWDNGTVTIALPGRSPILLTDYMREREGAIPGVRGGYVKLEPTDPPGHYMMTVRSFDGTTSFVIIDETAWTELSRRKARINDAALEARIIATEETMTNDDLGPRTGRPTIRH